VIVGLAFASSCHPVELVSLARLETDAQMSTTHNTVYVETSIPSFFYTLRSDPESIARMHWTRQWWQEYGADSNLVTSAAVVDELRQGVGDRTDDRVSLLDQVTLLPITDEVIEIAQVYIDKLVMPRDPTGDALHLALASYHKVDFLLTWNCRHLANAQIIRRVSVICNTRGYSMPVICTPEELMGV